MVLKLLSHHVHMYVFFHEAECMISESEIIFSNSNYEWFLKSSDSFALETTRLRNLCEYVNSTSHTFLPRLKGNTYKYFSLTKKPGTPKKRIWWESYIMNHPSNKATRHKTNLFPWWFVLNICSIKGYVKT